MKLLRKYGSLAALLTAVTVHADTKPPAPPPPPSTVEMRAQVETLDKEIDKDKRHVLHLQALARKDKDVIKLTCVNDKLIQMNAQMNLFENAQVQLESSLAAGDGLSAGPFADLEKAGRDVKSLRSEADKCAGELDMYKQESTTDVTRPDLDDPTETGGNFDNEVIEPEVEVPGFASPYK